MARKRAQRGVDRAPQPSDRAGNSQHPDGAARRSRLTQASPERIGRRRSCGSERRLATRLDAGERATGPRPGEAEVIVGRDPRSKARRDSAASQARSAARRTREQRAQQKDAASLPARPGEGDHCLRRPERRRGARPASSSLSATSSAVWAIRITRCAGVRGQPSARRRWRAARAAAGRPVGGLLGPVQRQTPPVDAPRRPAARRAEIGPGGALEHSGHDRPSAPERRRPAFVPKPRHARQVQQRHRIPAAGERQRHRRGRVSGLQPCGRGRPLASGKSRSARALGGGGGRGGAGLHRPRAPSAA